MRKTYVEMWNELNEKHHTPLVDLSLKGSHLHDEPILRDFMSCALHFARYFRGVESAELLDDVLKSAIPGEYDFVQVFDPEAFPIETLDLAYFYLIQLIYEFQKLKIPEISTLRSARYMTALMLNQHDYRKLEIFNEEDAENICKKCGISAEICIIADGTQYCNHCFQNLHSDGFFYDVPIEIFEVRQ